MPTLFHFYKSGRSALQRENVSLKSFSTITNLIKKRKVSLTKERQIRNQKKKVQDQKNLLPRQFFLDFFVFLFIRYSLLRVE